MVTSLLVPAAVTSVEAHGVPATQPKGKLKQLRLRRALPGQQTPTPCLLDQASHRSHLQPQQREGKVEMSHGLETEEHRILVPISRSIY